MQNKMHRGAALTAVLLLLLGLPFTFLSAQDTEQVTIPPQIKNMSIENLFQQGNNLIDEGKYTEAKPYFLAAIQKDSTQSGAYARLSDIAYKEYDLTEAQKYIKQAIEADQANEEYRVRFNAIADLIQTFQDGVDASKRRNYEEAVQKFNTVLDKYPGFAPAYYRLGFMYSSQNETDKAIGYFKKAIKQDPNNNNYTVALENLAKSHFQDGIEAYKRGNLATAANEFKTAIKVDSTFKSAQYMLGVVARRRGNTNEAIDRYQAAIKIDPDYEKAWFALGIAYKSAAKDKDALKAFTKATEINDYYDKAWVERGLLESKMQNYDAAVNSFQKSIQVNPQNPRAYEGLGMVYKKRQNYQKAAQQFETALGFDDTDYVLHYRLADTYHELGEYQKQKQEAQKALEYKANFAPALITLANAECHLGNTEASKQNYEKASRDADWRPVAQHNLQIMNKTGECE